MTVFETVELQPATNLRWSTKLNSFLSKNSDGLTNGCLLVFEKLGRSFSVHTIKSDNSKYDVLLEMFDEDEKHLLLSATLRRQDQKLLKSFQINGTIYLHLKPNLLCFLLALVELEKPYCERVCL